MKEENDAMTRKLSPRRVSFRPDMCCKNLVLLNLHAGWLAAVDPQEPFRFFAMVAAKLTPDRSEFLDVTG